MHAIRPELFIGGLNQWHTVVGHNGYTLINRRIILLHPYFYPKQEQENPNKKRKKKYGNLQGRSAAKQIGSDCIEEVIDSDLFLGPMYFSTRC